jgi:hypothetical protein
MKEHAMRSLIALALLTIAGGAFAQAPDPAEPAATPATRSGIADDDVGAVAADRRYDPLRVVCKRSRPRTGSRVVRDAGDTRICQTMAEWDRQAELGQEALRQRDRGTCGPNPCGVGHH